MNIFIATHHVVQMRNFKMSHKIKIPKKANLCAEVAKKILEPNGN